jgi:hypothetical protein
MAEDEVKTPLEMEMRGEEHREEELLRRFWDKRPDGMVLDKEEKVCYVLEFAWLNLTMRITTRREGGIERSFQGVSEDSPEIDSFRTKNVD